MTQAPTRTADAKASQNAIRSTDSNAPEQGTFVSLQRRMQEATVHASDKTQLLAALLKATPLRDKIEHAFYFTQDSDGQWTATASLGVLNNDEPLAGAVASACTTGTMQVRRLMAPARTLLATAIDSFDGSTDAIGVSIVGDNEEAALYIQLVASQLALWRAVRRNHHERAHAEDAAAVVDLMDRVFTASDRDRAYLRLCGELKVHLKCDQVALGLVDRAGRCRLQAVSEMSDFDPHSPAVKTMEAAMDEAAVRQQMGSWPSEDTDVGHSMVCHRQFVDDQRVPQVTSVPLMGDENQPLGVLLLIAMENPRNGRRFLQAAVEPLTTAVKVWEQQLHRKSTWALHPLTALRAFHHRKGFTVLGTFALVCSLMLVPVTYKVKCECTVEPVTRRYIAAPFESVLERCLVKPGEKVTEGQVLARLDGREVRLNRAKVLADRQQAVKRRDAAQASRQYSEQRIEQLEVERLDSELKILDQRAENLEIRSPIDGVIASGDLERTVGAPLSLGQLLFEVAPLGEMLIELAVDGSDIAYVEKSKRIDLRVNAYPSQLWESTVERIQPRAEIYEDTNVFVVEGRLANNSGKLRPGMKGRAKIHAGRHALGWVLFHKPWEYVTKRLYW